ncbi:MAG TPA: apolipoprotein N-acyltransferase [Azospirillum sp.]|nr:apolipoprotein N-acyltransferase [Azospirillum sp.]
MHVADTLPADRLTTRTAGRLAALAGWRRYAAAAALGALATFALPPGYAVPLLLIAFPGLLWLLEGAATRRQAFAIGWWFGFGHHLFGLYWVSFALFTDIRQFWWALPLSAAGLPVLLSMFTGLATLAVWLLPLRGGLARALGFAVVWAVFEWLRGHLFTGFPWNLVGYAWVGWLPVLQGVSFLGIYGLSLLTVLVAALPAAVADPAEPPRRVWAACAVGLLLFAGIGGWGALRLAGAPTENVPGVRLRLVQSGVEQRYKWQPEERLKVFETHLELSASPARDPVTHLIWPETAIPFFIETDAANRSALAAVTPPGGMTLTGAPRAVRQADGEVRYHNSLLAIDGSGAVRGSFDKAHLVPFGEYTPLRQYLPFGAMLGGPEFSAGPGPRTLHLAGLPPVSPLICYEAIFPAAVTDPADRPQWLLNLTNDAWYGQTAGPHQHFAITQVRAVEEGVPLVRSAQTGISGVVDSHGRVTAELPLGVRGVLDAALPKALPDATPYGRFGDWIFGVLLLATAALTLAARHTR